MRGARTHAAVVRRFVDAITSGDGAALDEVLTPDFVAHAPSEIAHAAERQDRARLRAEVERMADTLPDMQAAIHDLVVDGDRVAVRWSATGTHEGPLMDIPATGRRLTIRGMNVVRVVNGRIAEDWVQWDVLDLLRQLGRDPLAGP